METDVDLSLYFGEVIAEEYSAGLNYLQLDPASSLVKFRIVAELLCMRIASSKNVLLESDTLNERINELYDCQIIHVSFKDNLHRVRIEGNQGAHGIRSERYGNEDDQDYVDRIKAEYRKGLDARAISSRRRTIENLEDAYVIINGSPLNRSVEIVEIEDRLWEKDLVEALMSTCPKKKLRAGKIYESLAVNKRISDPFNMNYEFDADYNSIIKHAAVSYEASYKLSSGVGRNTSKKFNEMDFIKENSDSESLYLYWRIVNQSSFFGEEKTKECGWIIKHLALKEYVPAQCDYGKTLYDKGEYEQALSFYMSALFKSSDNVFVYLFDYYHQGLACKKDGEKALHYLSKGIELGCAASISQLGQLYHQGLYFEKDELKAEDLLIEAIQLGSVDAERYYLSNVIKPFKNEVKEILVSSMEKAIDNISALMNSSSKGKTGSNKPCPCKSGKKYKKCCKDKVYLMKRRCAELAEEHFSS